MPPRRSTAPKPASELPPAHDWRTTDADERLRRRLRAQEETPAIRALDPGDTVFGRYEVRSPSGQTYTVQLRALGEPAVAACSCTDFRINGLGTCKHIEAVLASLPRTRKDAWRRGANEGSSFADLAISVDGATLAIERNARSLPPALRALFDDAGRLVGATPEELVERLRARPCE
ncbi:MAG: SWIM zinc finger family protein, partial [Opitutaceae bacterium]